MGLEIEGREEAGGVVDVDRTRAVIECSGSGNKGHRPRRGQGRKIDMRRQSIKLRERLGFLSLFLLGACGAPGSGAEAADDPDTSPGVRPGIEVLLTDSLHLIYGHRVALVTNHTGIDAEGIPSIDRLHEDPGVTLVALFSPEHGIRGTAEAGVRVDDEEDPDTGLPIHSLYGETLKPTPEMLQGVEALLFDIQDIGTRYYTYVYTMALAMEAAGEEGIPFIVLDRPNPIDGVRFQGNVLDPEFASFVGRYPIPMRHGMTPGELARLFRAAFAVEAELHVVPADGWSREMLFPDTGLPWRAPSPSMPDLESALHYPGTCLFEGTNLSVGRGTERAFQWIGAPWLDGVELARRMGAHGLPGVRFHPARFIPSSPGDGKFDGVEVEGIRLEVTDAEIYDPTLVGVELLVETRRMSGDHWSWRADHFDLLAGTDELRQGIEAGLEAAELTERWAPALDEFGELRAAELIYPDRSTEESPGSDP